MLLWTFLTSIALFLGLAFAAQLEAVRAGVDGRASTAKRTTSGRRAYRYELMTTTSATPGVDYTRRQLRWVAIAAALDFLLLVPLVIASISDADDVIHILGLIHGIGFLIQLFLTVRGAGERLWGWWFPAIVVVTGGPAR